MRNYRGTEQADERAACLMRANTQPPVLPQHLAADPSNSALKTCDVFIAVKLEKLTGEQKLDICGMLLLEDRFGGGGGVGV